MRRLVVLWLKEWLALSRDVHGLAVLFLMPAAFIVVMSLALSDVFKDGASRRTDFAVLVAGETHRVQIRAVGGECLQNPSVFLHAPVLVRWPGTLILDDSSVEVDDVSRARVNRRGKRVVDPQLLSHTGSAKSHEPDDSSQSYHEGRHTSVLS